MGKEFWVQTPIEHKRTYHKTNRKWHLTSARSKHGRKDILLAQSMKLC